MRFAGPVCCDGKKHSQLFIGQCWHWLSRLHFSLFFVCYFNFIRGLYFTRKICAKQSTESSRVEGIEAKRKIVRLSITITIIFIACFFPYAIATVVGVSIRSTFYRIVFFLVYCSCCVNPICYALQSSNYRTALKETISRSRKFTNNQTEEAV